MKRNNRTDAAENGRAQNGKSHKRKRRGATARLYVMVLFFMLTIGVVLIFTVFFKVAKIDTIGLTRYAEEDVVASSGITPGMNMFRLNRAGICNNLVGEYSYFGEVRLKFTLPDTVTIQVTEAEPAGAIKQGEGYLLFSEQGRVLETGVAAPPKSIPTIKGFSESLGLTAGQRLDTTDEEKLKALLEKIADLQRKIAGSKAGEKVLAEKQAELDGYQKQADAITTELAGRMERLEALNAFLTARRDAGLMGVTAIDLTDPKNLIVSCGSRVELKFGTIAELPTKIKMAQHVLTEDPGPDFEGRIDLSKAGKATTTAMDVTVADMTPEEYAQFLYESASSEAQSSAPQSSAPAASAAPAAPAVSAEPELPEQSSIAAEEVPATEEEPPVLPNEEDFVAGVEE